MLRQILALMVLVSPAWAQCPSQFDPSIAAPGANDLVAAFASFDEGAGSRLFAGGTFTAVGGALAAHVARWDGTSWSSVGSGINGPVYALAVYDDGSGPALYAGGNFTTAGGTAASSVARWNGSAWSALVGGGVVGVVRAFAVFDDGAGFGPSLFVGGDITSAGGLATPSIARWNASGWSTVGSLQGGITDFAVYDDGHGGGRQLYASGFFPASQSSYLLQRWNGAVWSDAPAGVPTDATPEGGGYALCVWNDGTGPALYFGGSFAQDRNIVRLDGNGWSHLGSGVFYSDFAYVYDLIVHDDGTGPALWATGLFRNAGGVQAGSLAKWNGLAWSAPTGGLQFGSNVGRGLALASHDDGQGQALFVGGDFDHNQNVTMHEIARLGAAGGLPVVTAPVGPTVANVGDIVQFTISATGTGPLSYAWVTPGYGAGATGTNTPTLTVEVVSVVAAQGEYLVVVTGPCGSTSSTAIHLAVSAGPGTSLCGCQALAPCGNSAHAPTQGCGNSVGKSGWLAAQGTASVANDTLVLLGQDMTSSSVLYFQGTSAVAGGGAVFGDGLRCASGTVVRLGIHANVNGASVHPGLMNTPISVAGGLAGGDVRVYQAWYRDAGSFCTSATFNLTNGVLVSWQP